MFWTQMMTNLKFPIRNQVITNQNKDKKLKVTAISQTQKITFSRKRPPLITFLLRFMKNCPWLRITFSFISAYQYLWSDRKIFSNFTSKFSKIR